MIQALIQNLIALTVISLQQKKIEHKALLTVYKVLFFTLNKN